VLLFAASALSCTLALMSHPRVHLEIAGDGPSVLFLHGMPTSWDVFRPVARALGGRRTLLAALPGYGPTPAWPEATSAVAIAEAIEEAVRAAGVDRAAVVGFSAGAYHALHLAVRGRFAIDRVITLAGFADLSAEERGGMRGFAAALRAGANLDGVATARFLSPPFAKTHPDACARVEAWLRATSRENLARELDACAESPPLLDMCAARVVARAGSLDLVVPPAHAEAIAKTARHGVAQVVEGSGHALLEENLDATTAAIVRALA